MDQEVKRSESSSPKGTIRDRLPIAVFIALLFIGVAPLIITSIFNHPSADDYSYTVDFMRPAVLNGGGIVEVIKAAADTSAYFYDTWQGLYTSAFFLALQPAIFGEGFYALTAPILMMVTLASFLLLFYVVKAHILKSSSGAWVVMAIAAWFYFLQTLPSPVEGLYWFNGAFNYVLLWCFYIVTICFSLISLCSEGRKPIVFLILATIAAFLTAGGNHVTTVACIFTLLLLLIVQVAKMHRFTLVLPLVVCVVGLAIVMAAPGTAIRSDALGVDWGSSLSLFATLLQAPFIALDYLGQWTNLSYICLLLLLTPCAIDLFRKSSNRPHITLGTIVIFALGLFLLMVVMLCPPLYAMKNGGTGRLTNVIFLSFVAYGALLYIFIAFLFLEKNESNKIAKAILAFFDSTRYSFRAYAIGSLCLCLILFSFGSGLGFQRTTWITACEDLLNGCTVRFDREMDARISVLENPDIDDVAFDPIANRPRLLYFADLAEDPDEWPNSDVARYYGKSSVRLNN